jgi:hypothetical protein
VSWKTTEALAMRATPKQAAAHPQANIQPTLLLPLDRRIVLLQMLKLLWAD